MQGIFIFSKRYQTLVACVIHDDKLLTLERDSDSKNACLSVPPDWTLGPIDVSLSGHISGCFSVVSRNPFLLRFISKTSNDSATGGSEKLWSSEAGCDIWLYAENNQLRQKFQFLIYRPLHLSARSSQFMLLILDLEYKKLYAREFLSFVSFPI